MLVGEYGDELDYEAADEIINLVRDECIHEINKLETWLAEEVNGTTQICVIKRQAIEAIKNQNVCNETKEA